MMLYLCLADAIHVVPNQQIIRVVQLSTCQFCMVDNQFCRHVDQIHRDVYRVSLPKSIREVQMVTHPTLSPYLENLGAQNPTDKRK